MEDHGACNVCGSTQRNLFDGFYYCVECGTQDTNLRDTMVEYLTKEDGTVMHGDKRRLTQVQPTEQKEEMDNSWYIWHGINFLLSGLADELIKLGAKPSFKRKLLWIWTKYLKKYRQSDGMGMIKDSTDDNTKSEENEQESSSDSESECRIPNRWKLSFGERSRLRKLKTINFKLILSLLYTALNLDKSEIQISHMLRLFKNKFISMDVKKYIPAEMKPNLIHIERWMTQYQVPEVEPLQMSLFKHLDIGLPCVPNVRSIVENYLKELCLPSSFKEFVFALMQFRSCSYFDIVARERYIKKVPNVEMHCMAYIMWALKLCFGLDDEYEVEMSNVVDDMNKAQKHPRAYSIHPETETRRLFSFKEWLTYLQFRQAVLEHKCPHLSKCNIMDVNPKVARKFFALGEDVGGEIHDELTANIINDLEGDEPVDMVPSSEFQHTLTPYATYTQVILQYMQDSDVKLALSEDFTKYSIHYLEDMRLKTPQCIGRRTIILKGVSTENKKIYNHYMPCDKLVKESLPLRPQMVYVKDCDNHNWMKTKQPKKQHVVEVDPPPTKQKKIEKPKPDKNIKKEKPNKKQLSSISRKVLRVISQRKGHRAGLRTKKAESDKIEYIVIQVVDGNDKLDESVRDLEDERRQVIDSLLEQQPEDTEQQNDSEVNCIGDLVDQVPTAVEQSTETDEIERKQDIDSLEQASMDTEFKSVNQEADDENSEEPQLSDAESVKTEIDPEEDNITHVIPEEEQGVNIFDDDFADLDVVIKTENNNVEIEHDDKQSLQETLASSHNFNQDNTIPNYMADNEFDSDSDNDYPPKEDISSLTREEIISRLVHLTCKKYTILIPSKYIKKKVKTEIPKDTGAQPLIKCKNRANRIINETEVTDLMSKYYTHLQQDVLYQVAQEVKAAVLNSKNQSILDNNEEPPINDNVSMLPENLSMPMEADNTDGKSEVPNKSENTVEEIKESFFSEESDGETNAAEFLPKKNPRFDEETHHIDQLYLKVKRPKIEKMEFDPKVIECVDRKIKRDTEDPSLLEWTSEKVDPKTDSEEDVPLSDIKVTKDLIKNPLKQEEGVVPLVNKKKISVYNYWMQMRYHRFWNHGKTETRQKEINKDFPKSYAAVAIACADVCGCRLNDLLTCLNNMEVAMLEILKISLKRQYTKPLKSNKLRLDLN